VLLLLPSITTRGHQSNADSETETHKEEESVWWAKRGREIQGDTKNFHNVLHFYSPTS